MSSTVISHKNNNLHEMMDLFAHYSFILLLLKTFPKY